MAFEPVKDRSRPQSRKTPGAASSASESTARSRERSKSRQHPSSESLLRFASSSWRHSRADRPPGRKAAKSRGGRSPTKGSAYSQIKFSGKAAGYSATENPGYSVQKAARHPPPLDGFHTGTTRKQVSVGARRNAQARDLFVAEARFPAAYRTYDDRVDRRRIAAACEPSCACAARRASDEITYEFASNGNAQSGGDSQNDGLSAPMRIHAARI